MPFIGVFDKQKHTRVRSAASARTLIEIARDEPKRPTRPHAPMMSATHAARNRRRTRAGGLSAATCAFCGSGMDLFSQRDVTNLRPHPGTTILFCAIKENPRRNNCRLRIRARSSRRKAEKRLPRSAWLHEVICRNMRAVASSQHEKKSPRLRAICDDGDIARR